MMWSFNPASDEHSHAQAPGATAVEQANQSLHL